MGGGKSKKAEPVKEAAIDTDPSHYQNSGYNQTMNPFTSQGKPDWMQGNFAMDTWGKSAADPRISLTQDMLSPYGMPIHNAAVNQMAQYDQQAAQGLNPQMPQWMGQLGGQPMSLADVMTAKAPAYSPRGMRAGKAPAMASAAQAPGLPPPTFGG